MPRQGCFNFAMHGLIVHGVAWMARPGMASVGRGKGQKPRGVHRVAYCARARRAPPGVVARARGWLVADEVQ